MKFAIATLILSIRRADAKVYSYSHSASAASSSSNVDGVVHSSYDAHEKATENDRVVLDKTMSCRNGICADSDNMTGLTKIVHHHHQPGHI